MSYVAWEEKFNNLVSEIEKTKGLNLVKLDSTIEEKMTSIVADIVALRNVEQEFIALHKISLDVRMLLDSKYEETVEAYGAGKVTGELFMGLISDLCNSVALSLVRPIGLKYEKKKIEMNTVCFVMDKSLELLNSALLLVYKKDRCVIDERVLEAVKKLFDDYEDMIRDYQSDYVAVSVLNSGSCYLGYLIYGSYDCPEIEAIVKYLKANKAMATNDRGINPELTFKPVAKLIKSLGFIFKPIMNIFIKKYKE